MPISRREMLGYLVTGSCALGAAALGSAAGAGTAGAAPRVLGTIIDYSADVPPADAIRAAGYAGAIRYVSQPRPGAEWMHAKPMRKAEADALTAAGLQVVSCYQYGKGSTDDWRGGFDAGVHHATIGRDLHRAAGGPDDRPIYASIDANPGEQEFEQMVAPYLKGWESVVGHDRTGVYCNSHGIDRATSAGLGSWFWMHNWGTPNGYVHPKANLHQLTNGDHAVGGIAVDENAVLTADYGQWSRS